MLWYTFFLTQIVYNAMGEILIPFVCHAGNVSADSEDKFRSAISFMDTCDGDLNLNSLCLMGLFVET